MSILFVIARKGNVPQILSFTDWYNDLEKEIWLAVGINLSWAFVALKRNVEEKYDLIKNNKWVESHVSSTLK